MLIPYLWDMVNSVFLQTRNQPFHQAMFDRGHSSFEKVMHGFAMAKRGVGPRDRSPLVYARG